MWHYATFIILCSSCCLELPGFAHTLVPTMSYHCSSILIIQLLLCLFKYPYLWCRLLSIFVGLNSKHRGMQFGAHLLCLKQMFSHKWVIKNHKWRILTINQNIETLFWWKCLFIFCFSSKMFFFNKWVLSKELVNSFSKCMSVATWHWLFW